MSAAIRGMLGAALAALAVSPACADWQFTHWDMTPDQVVQASHGAAVSVDPTDLSSINGDRVLLQMPYAAGDFHFTAGFAFDTADHLDRVHLTLNSGAAGELRAALVAKYGDPKEQDPDFSAFGGRMIWIAAGEQITYFQMGSNSPGVTPNVSIDYVRHAAASGNGL